MRRSFTFALAAFAALAAPLAAHAVAGNPTDEPVRLVMESGRDVGNCPAGGVLTYPPEPYKSTAYWLVEKSGPLHAQHRAITGGATPAWIREMKGVSNPNRLYLDQAGNKVLVFDACLQGQCDTQQVRGAYLMGRQSASPYGLEIRNGSATSTAGTLTPPLRAALACAAGIDEKVRQRSVDAINGVGRR